MGAKLSFIETYFPERVITNKELVSMNTTLTEEKISGKLGIMQRHVAADDETALDLAYHAGVKILKKIDRQKIDFLILCTQSPDYFLPTSACILQHKLELKKGIGAFDYNLGCSGYVYGLAIVKGLIAAKVACNVLLIMAETYSKMLAPADISNRSIFGDGAAATLIEYSENEDIKSFELGTDGEGYDKLIVKNGCFRNPYASPVKATNIVNSGDNLFMNGPEIFNFTIEAIPNLIDSVLKKNELTIDEIDYFIFHQANKYMLEYLRNKIKIPKDKFYINMQNTGNTVSATIPIALKDAIDSGLIINGAKVMLCGFGVGYSWGATVIQL